MRKIYLGLLPGVLLFNACTESNASSTVNTASTVSQTNNIQKNNAVAYIKPANTGVDPLLQETENRRIRDSIAFVNKKEKFAYQIGMPYSGGRDAVWAYKNLDMHGIEGLYVLRNKMKQYILVCGVDKSEKQLNSELEKMISKLGDIDNATVRVVDLRDFCPEKEIIIGNGLLLKRDSMEVPCLVCE